MNGLCPRHRIPVDTLAGSAPNLFIGGADIEYLVGSRGHHPKDFTNVFRELAKLFFATFQGLLVLLALGDISKEPHPSKVLLPAVLPQAGGIAFQYPPVFQFNLAAIVGSGIVVEFANPF